MRYNNIISIENRPNSEGLGHSYLNFLKVHSFKKNVIFQFCKNLKKNFDSGICMFDVVKCHLSIWTDFKREYSRIFQINQWSIIINSKRILAPYVKIVVRVIYVQEMFKKYAART